MHAQITHVTPTRKVAAGLIAILALGACSSSGKKSASDADATTTTVAAGSNADSNATDWMFYGHDLAQTRRNAEETTITPASVKSLKPDWSIDGLTGVTGTPTIAAGVAYFGDWTGHERAVDAATGKENWSTEIGGMIVGAPTVDGDAVFASSGATLYRLNRATGKIEWKAVTNDSQFAQINASPVVVDGLVLQGVASFEVVMARDKYTFRGSISAYDAQTGKEKWRFYATKADAKDGAGVGIWSTPAVDKTRGLLYVGTGNAYTEPTGPLADSLIALDYKTGALKWHRQFTYPDVFSAGHPGGKDADVGASPNLWTSDGHDLIGAGDKAGVYHALDRDTGKLVWERRLTPGGLFGGEIGSGAFVDGKIVVVSNVDKGKYALVFALDPATGKVLWKSEQFPQMIFAPVSAVPGLAFVGTTAGLFTALDTNTGKRLWSKTAPAKVACGPSIVDGRIVWGYGFTLFGGGGPGGVVSFTPAS
jgi:polyvinyl alcohol dehydrogenase (cytochrome)